ncbi:hypothetical protein MAR_001083 [Mya arenaria]|uniref:C2H2-type domain-containing protein n=2 Tax=Mya arenaria TaxID=6604 RepID=A0ABY7FAW3_MYAAR|nr:hypothetical protein MAR_001083 [Mya arenaria]
MEESGEHVCDLCKVTYASESELDDHNWSLMHHIKVEKIKKGAPHSCNLCMLTCSNLIDYGKHLNEDRHKLALSRRAKEGNEMLDSFAGSGNIFEAETKNDRNLQPDQKEKPRSLLDMPLPAQFAHSQMFNESFMQNQFGPSSYPAHFDYQPANWQEFLDISQGQGPSWKGNSRGGQRDQMIGDGHGEGKGRFKVPRGRGRGHQRTHSDIHPREIPVSFYEDDFQGVNWNDHHFYSDSYGDRQMKDEFPWNDTGRGRSGRDKRRGSFDSTFTRNDRGYPAETSSPELKNWDGSDPRETPERGRGILRDGRYHRRSRSYENISPESNSSSDSSLKRRRENEDQVGLTQPERSRRRIIAPDQYASSSSGYQSGRSSRLMEDRSNHRPRSRSTSQDRSLSLRESRSETESEGKAKSVSWSDQQQVSSTSEKQEEERKVRKSHYGQSRPDTGMNGQDQRDVRGYRKARTAIEEKQTILPDSSSDLEEKKRTNINMMKSRNKAGARRNQSPKGERKGVATGDNTESILEKAEKLCQKLRSEREQASKKKKSEEKIKKMEKETELNKKLETLAEMNKSNIRGVLDMEMSAPLGSRPELPVSASNSDVLDSLSSSDTGSSVKAAGTLSRKVTAEKPYAVQRARNESQEVAERIARTKADIDSIRAKIESSVQNEMSGQKVSAPSAEMSIPPTRYPASTDQSALVKMVNSPRTPKEKLSLAQMLREHAKSQTKFSLQRFNLKYSDLCSGVGEKGDEYTNINVDQLDTNSILEIANLIELDIKPDIGYLEQLLDKASVENVVLDEAVLSNLGIQGGSAVKSKASPSPSSVQHGTMSPNRTQSPVRRNIHSDYAEREIKTTNEKITRHRSRSPISEKNNREQQMPPPRREHFLGEQYESPSFHTGVPAPQRVLDLDDLRSTRGRKSPSPIPGKAAIDEHGNRFSSSLPISNPPLTNASQLSSSTSSITP